MFDLITIGHATVDYFLKVSQAQVTKSGDGRPQLCLNYGDKIPVDNFTKSAGGNAPNTAIGCTRLGIKTAIITWLGKDSEAELVLQALKNEGVELFWVKINPEEQTDESIILSFERDRTILSYHFPRKYTLPLEPPEGKWVYLTSTGEGFGEFQSEVLTYVKKLGARLAYNPGMHELAAGLEGNRAVLSRAEVLILNKEEALGLVGEGEINGTDEALRLLSEKLVELGPACVVITDGANGAYGLEGADFYHVPAPEVTVVEKTGAGDAFSAGFLAARISGKDLEESLRWGIANSSAVISQVGSQSGLLTNEELVRAI